MADRRRRCLLRSTRTPHPGPRSASRPRSERRSSTSIAARGIDGTRVLIQGAGHVGAALARDLAADGAEIVISDIDAKRAAAIAAEVGGSTVAADEVIGYPRAICSRRARSRRSSRPPTADACAAGCIVGAANDTLADPGCAELLAARQIVYVPDFVSNAGGVIHIHALRRVHGEKRLHDDVMQIGTRTREVLEVSLGTGRDAAADRDRGRRRILPTPATLWTAREAAAPRAVKGRSR